MASDFHPDIQSRVHITWQACVLPLLHTMHFPWLANAVLCLHTPVLKGPLIITIVALFFNQTSIYIYRELCCISGLFPGGMLVWHVE